MAAHHRDALSRLRLLVAGGDVVPADLAAAVSAGCPDTVLLNGYGPTENTTFSTAFVAAEWDRTESESLPIGRAVAGTRCYLLDDRLRPVPAGQVGELCLGGDRLAWGYLGDPAATAARFRPDPFVGSPGARMYRTGDRARELPGGSLQFLGRLDDEVKVRGFRVTLGAAEAVLAEDTEVADVVVLATGTGADRVLVGFVRPSTVDVSALRARAWQRAPRHLVPDTIRALDAFPLGANGKVDRDALLADVADPSHDHNDGNGHGTPLAEIWQRRTGVVAEPDADFFVSGGSSLDLMRMIEDIRTGIQVDLDFAEVYATTSFTELADLINTRRRPAASD
jgi:acyl-CoA synthetase (AMP-forming)/AMP-acid ligase II